MIESVRFRGRPDRRATERQVSRIPSPTLSASGLRFALDPSDSFWVAGRVGKEKFVKQCVHSHLR